MAKEPVTTFDLNSAFKALDEIEVPVAEKGIAANRLDLTETMKKVAKTDLLLEDYYDVRSNEDLQDAADEREAEIAKAKLARIEKIVDLEAESEEDLLPSYEGKIIIQCPQCMTLFYKNPEDIETTEDSDDIVNINEVCQHCGNASGYTVIGRVQGIDEDEAANYEAAEDLTDDEDLNELDLDFDLDDEDLEAIPEEEIPEEANDSEEVVEDEEETEEEDEEEVKESTETTSGTTILIESTETEEAAAAEDTPTEEPKEDLEEGIELTEDEDVSAETFKKLMSTSEFKTAISDSEVAGYLEDLNAAEAEGEELEEGIKDFLGNLKKKASSATQKVRDGAAAIAKRLGTSKNDKAIAVAAEVTGEDLDETSSGYKYYVIPYKKGVKGQPTRSYAAISETETVHAYPIDKYESAEKQAINISTAKDTDICEVDIVIGKDGLKPSDFIYPDGKKLHNGKMIAITNHPETLAAYVEGKNYATDIGTRFQTTVKNNKATARADQAKEDGVEVTEPAVTTEQPAAADGNAGETTETPQAKPKRRVATPKAPEVPEKGKVTIVYGTKNKQGSVEVSGLIDGDIEKAKTLAQGRSLKSAAVLVDENGNKTKYVGGVEQTLADDKKVYQDGENVLESLMTTLEDLDEAGLETRLTESLTNVYENVDKFVITDCSFANSTLMVEGTITFKSGKTLDTVYKFTEAYTTNGNAYKLVGTNETFTESAFIVNGYTENNGTNFLTEQVEYTYKTEEALVEGFTGKPKAMKN